MKIDILKNITVSFQTLRHIHIKFVQIWYSIQNDTKKGTIPPYQVLKYQAGNWKGGI